MIKEEYLNIYTLLERWCLESRLWYSLMDLMELKFSVFCD